VSAPTPITGGTVTPVTIRARPTQPVDRVMPTEGPLVDRYGRVHRDLRLSITDRCNLRCVYCMAEDMAFLPHRELLTFDEIVRVAEVAHELGITSVRVTGGEPLVRRGVTDLVTRLKRVGFDDVSLTTNGTELGRLASALAAAGLDRVNVSCDSLRPDRYAAIRRRGSLAPVLDAMAAAERAGLAPLKVNVVLMAGVNDDEVLDFAEFARATGRIVRFIEFMPLDGDGTWRRDQVVPAAEVVERIDERWALEAVPVEGADASAPAERFRFVDGGGEIGVIASVTRPFCGTCDRLRLTADGAVRNCLFARHESSARDLVRAGASDDEIARLLREAVWAKLPGHGINDPTFIRPARSMSMIGG
jgi:cyclic pyranopterin phosphate synthase